MSNEPLFNKMKSELENLRPAYDQADWQKMEQMLDSRKRVVPMWLWRVAAGVAILLVTVFGLLYAMQNDAPTTIAESAHTSTFQLDIGNLSTANINQATDATSARSTSATQQEDARATAGSHEQDDQVEKQQLAVIPSSSGSPFMEMEPSAYSAEDDQDHGAATSNTADQEKTTKDLPPLSSSSSLLLRKKELSYIDNNTALTTDWTTPEDQSAGNSRSNIKVWAGPSAKPSLQFVQNAQGAFGQGLTAGLDMRNGIGMESGIYYEQLKYRESPTGSFALGEAHLRSQGKFKGLSIPLRINYRFNSGRIVQPLIQAGLTAFLPLQAEYVFEYDNIQNYSNTSGNQAALNERASVRDTVTITNNSRPKFMDQSNNANFDYNSKSGESYLPGQSNKLYLMATAGAGVRVYASPKLSFQLSANYGLPLSSLGIEDRNLNQIDMGVAMQYYIN